MPPEAVLFRVTVFPIQTEVPGVAPAVIEGTASTCPLQVTLIIVADPDLIVRVPEYEATGNPEIKWIKMGVAFTILMTRGSVMAVVE